ncbi:MAG: hypothetical protein WKF75_11795 [Singulisphaera sp.]
MEETEDSISPALNVETEIKELLGLFDAPAFARRGQDLEYALARLHDRCARQRDAMLDMVRVRLRQWSSAVTGPEGWSSSLTAPIDPLWTLGGAEPPAWTDRPAPIRRQRTIARDLVASLNRFNRRWSGYLDGLDLEPSNRTVDLYNRYYLLEKECSLGSARLAARHFVPQARVTREALLEAHPTLPVPGLVA